MRWDDLFDDLSARAEHEEQRDRAAEVADRVRREQATVRLVDRLRAATGPLTLTLVDGSVLRGAVTAGGGDWVLLDTAPGQALVPCTAIRVVQDVPTWSAAPQGEVAARRSFGMVLRSLGLSEVAVTVRLAGDEVRGRVDRVGADHVDLAVGAGRVSVPFHGVLAVLERD